MMKIIIIGKNGNVGKAVSDLMKHNFDVIEYGSELDISNYSQLKLALERDKPNVVINAAAYNEVDRSEIEKQQAHSSNAIGPMNLAKLSHQLKFKLVHYSTNFVFDGFQKRPYTEVDGCAPLNYYGQAKLEGDLAVMEESSNYVIIRTSWIYGGDGEDFVKWFLRNKNRLEVKIVDDQVANPCYVNDIAEFTQFVITNDIDGLINFANEGACSKFEMIQYVKETLNLSIDVLSAKSSDFDSLAIRPQYASLDLSFVKNELNYYIPSWKESLKNYLKKYMEGE